MLKNLARVVLLCFFARFKNFELTRLDENCLDEFGIPSDTESLNSAYHVLFQNGNKIKNLSSFAKCTACMPTGEKLDSFAWSCRFNEDSINDSDTFCEFASKAFAKGDHISYWFAQLASKSIKDLNRLLFRTEFVLIDTEGNRLNISWYLDKLGNGSIKDFNEVIQSEDINLIDSNGEKLCLLDCKDKLASASIKDWNEILRNEDINTEGIVVNGRVIEEMRCKFTDDALEQAEHAPVIPELEEENNYRNNRGGGIF